MASCALVCTDSIAAAVAARGGAVVGKVPRPLHDIHPIVQKIADTIGVVRAAVASLYAQAQRLVGAARRY